MGQLGLGNQTDAVPSPAQVPGGLRPAQCGEENLCSRQPRSEDAGLSSPVDTVQTCLGPEASGGGAGGGWELSLVVASSAVG